MLLNVTPTEEKKRGRKAKAETQPAAPVPVEAAEAAPAAAPPKPRRIRRFPREELAPYTPDPNALPVRVIPLGGLEEIGKNMTIIEYGDDAIMLDCGMAFPNDDEVYGIDVVIPDISYLDELGDKLRGIVLTHGHEDHIGSLPYVLRDHPIPVFGTKLTIGFVNGKLVEHNLTDRARMFGVVNAGDCVQLGDIIVEFIHVNHSIPDAVGMAIHTPGGVIVHTGDFKIDQTPISGGAIDLPRLSQLGQEGVLLLMSDSTNSERPGFTMTERKVGRSFDTIFEMAENKRILIATFSSNIHRLQQIINTAAKFGRKVAVNGRSMISNFAVASELGYIDAPDSTMIEVDQLNDYPPEKTVIITTGSQGEPMSALSRMAFSDHRKIEVGEGDLVVISATPIPGNERMVSRVVNKLMKLGVQVIYDRMYDVHVSGHACQEEQKLILSLVKPKYFMPVHGEYRHLRIHANNAIDIGIPPQNIILAENGNVIEMTEDSIEVVGSVPAGRVFVDGLGVGDVGSVVLRDRRLLSQDGILTVAAVIDIMTVELVSGPEIVTRGFVFIKESEELLEGLRNDARHIIEELTKRQITDINIYNNEIREALSKKIYHTMKRSPIVVPLIMEV
ncbi:MAG: ribonuclease J [Clostridia bacterium]|nr:ribonuclease J [Clostridia bacterium]